MAAVEATAGPLRRAADGAALGHRRSRQHDAANARGSRGGEGAARGIAAEDVRRRCWGRQVSASAPLAYPDLLTAHNLILDVKVVFVELLVIGGDCRTQLASCALVAQKLEQ